MRTVRTITSCLVSLPPTCRYEFEAATLFRFFTPSPSADGVMSSLRGQNCHEGFGGRQANVLKGYPCLLTQLACCFATFSLLHLKLLLCPPTAKGTSHARVFVNKVLIFQILVVELLQLLSFLVPEHSRSEVFEMYGVGVQYEMEHFTICTVMQTRY
jgi:hypothetical protein